MTDEPGDPLYRVHVLGPLSVRDARGADRTPPGRKTQALLALLALSPRGARSRAWLRDKLWSESPPEQASASLRQALATLRRAFGPDADRALRADAHTVVLDPDRVVVLDEGEDGELLEGLDVGDAEFEEWLLMERQARRARPAGLDAAPRRPRAEARPALEAAAPRRPGPPEPTPGYRVGLRRARSDDPALAVAAAAMEERLAACLLETGEIAVVPLGLAEAPPSGADAPLAPLDCLLDARLARVGASARCVLSAIRPLDRALLFVASDVVDVRPLAEGDPTALGPAIRRAVDALLRRVVEERLAGPDPRAIGAGLVLAAVDRMFRLAPGDLDEAEAGLRAALAASGSPQAAAWLAFVATFRIGQRHAGFAAPLIEEAQALGRRAAAAAPDNALVLALCGHLHSFLFGEYDVATDLFERALALNPAQPLAWDLYAMLHAYVGRPEAGLGCARWARALGAYSPYRFYFDTSCCIAASLSGRHEEALRAGRLVLEERPQFNSPLRFLVASHAHLGQRAQAEAALARLLAVEPGFSVEALRESRYPLLRAGGGDLFVDGLVAAGAPRASR